MLAPMATSTGRSRVPTAGATPGSAPATSVEGEFVVSASESTSAPRLRRPRWRDPRLIVGVLLVLASVASVVALVQNERRTVAYWAAATDIAPGRTVEAADLVPVEVNLGSAGGRYLAASEQVPAESTVVAAVRAGELVPAEAVVREDPKSRRHVGLTLGEPLPEGVGVGDRVDVWVAQPQESGQGHERPELTAKAVEIAEVSTQSGPFAGADQVRVQVLIGPEELPEILAGKVADARITVLPSVGGK